MSRRKKTDLTLREQMDLLHGNGSWHIAGVPRLGIPDFEMHDGPLGLRYVSEDNGLDLGSSDPAVCYPAPCLTACSFDADLLNRLGASMALEFAAKNTNMILAPGANIKRNPLCGRNFEYLSEDPYLSGKLAAAFINGAQQNHVGCCIKHFACNSQEAYRLINDSIVDERALHELYLKSFEIAIKDSNPWAVMAAYNKINGTYASDNDYLLKLVLRDQWKYQGVVMSDWGGTNDYVDSHNHGLDVEMPCLYPNRSLDLMKAYRFKHLSDKAVFESSQRVLEMLRKATLGPKHPKPFDQEAGHALAVEIAEKSMVLLKNEGVLPLKKSDDICIIGELARTMRYQGCGSAKMVPYRLRSFIDVINEGRSKPIPFAPGYTFDHSGDSSVIMDAVDLASRCKTPIVFLGLPPDSESEGFDRETMLLPEDQLRMLDAVAAVNENLIVVLCIGSPAELPFLSKVKGLLLAYLGGEGAAEAILDLLYGKVSPSGKLAETWPIHLVDTPSFGIYPGPRDFSLYKESIYVGYRYYLTADKKVQFPFGYGLSYANFKQKMRLSSSKLGEDETLMVEVEVSNLSSKPAERIIQIYVSAQESNVFRPLRTLAAFTKVSLKGKEHKVVTLAINRDAFAFYDTDSGSFKVEGGTYSIELAEDAATIIESMPVQVAGEEFEDRHAQLPTYYSLNQESILLNDDAFEMLLGHSLPSPVDHRSRPFNLNSTFDDISWTWIGKKIAKEMERRIGKSIDDPSAKAAYAMFFGTPIRNIGMGGGKLANPRFMHAILAIANRKPLQALFRLIFGVSGMKGKQ